MHGRLSACILCRAPNYILTLKSRVTLQEAHRCHLSFWDRFGANRWSSTHQKPIHKSRSQHHFSTHQRLHFQQSHIQTNNILKTYEQSVEVPVFDGKVQSVVRRFDSNQLPANKHNEDRRNAAICLKSKSMLFGVFDGHGGWQCAQAVSERLLCYMAVARMKKHNIEDLENCVVHGKAVPPILQWYKHHLSNVNNRELALFYAKQLRVFWQELLKNGEHEDGMSPSDAMCCAFTRLDADISSEAQLPLSSVMLRSTAIQVAFSGSTACVAHVDTNGIHIANVGDSRAVLGVRNEDGTWGTLPLSHDHNTENDAELERITAQHPPSESETLFRSNRLLGMLVPLRAFGNMRFKWSHELQQSILASIEPHIDLNLLNFYRRTPTDYLTPPYLDATPEITYHKLRPQDRFLILGTDGLWDRLSSTEAVHLVGEYLNGSRFQVPFSSSSSSSEKQMRLGQIHKLLLKRQAHASTSLDTNAATHLIRYALGRDEYGNMSHERVDSMLQLPVDLARMYRDDITVTVVFLKSDLAEHHHS